MTTATGRRAAANDLDLGKGESALAESLRIRLAKLATTYGFGGATYVHLGHGLGGAADPSIRSAPLRLISASGTDADPYLRRGDLTRDPLTRRAAESLLPFAWTPVDLPHPARRRDVEARGACCGLIVPVQDYVLGPAFLDLYHAGPTAADVYEPNGLRGLLMLAATQFHAAAIALPASVGSGPSTSLTLREMSVLRLAAVGRTELETAVILSLSRRGVQYHLSRAAEKLGAANKTAAVARAVSAGLIRVESGLAAPGPPDSIRQHA